MADTRPFNWVEYDGWERRGGRTVGVWDASIGAEMYRVYLHEGDADVALYYPSSGRYRTIAKFSLVGHNGGMGKSLMVRQAVCAAAAQKGL
jgi:hypothetical protein